MSLYNRGHRQMVIGTDFGVTKYRDIADALKDDAAKKGHQHGVFAFKKNSSTPDAFNFPTGEAAANQYDELANAPGEYVYLYLYKNGAVVDEGYFVATTERKIETRTETKKERVGLGWILGGVGLGLLGLSMGFRQRKG